MEKVTGLIVILSILFTLTMPDLALALAVEPVPEPSTLALLIAGIIGLAGLWKIRK